MIGRIFPHPGLSAILALVWLLLQNDLSALTFAGALTIGIAVPIFTAPFWPRRPHVRFGVGGLYVLLVIWDIIVANFEIAYVILFKRNADLRPCWLIIPLELDTPEAITVLAGTISLTPGTVSSDISACGRYLLVHALDTGDPDGEITRIKTRYEDRLKKVFQ